MGRFRRRSSAASLKPDRVALNAYRIVAFPPTIVGGLIEAAELT